MSFGHAHTHTYLYKADQTANICIRNKNIIRFERKTQKPNNNMLCCVVCVCSHSFFGGWCKALVYTNFVRKEAH